jgi:hydrocephalus-inducing protein
VTINVEGIRTEYTKLYTSPFSVEPATGFIEAGQVTTFMAKFCPEEVDDFTATLKCEIPFLGEQPPPELNVSGRSRRPLCHFNIKMSDYLSAGRRHPNYTDPLPADA